MNVAIIGCGEVGCIEDFRISYFMGCESVDLPASSLTNLADFNN